MTAFCNICDIEFLDGWAEKEKHMTASHYQSAKPTRTIYGEEICNRCSKTGRKLLAVDVGRDFNLEKAYIWLCQYCRGIEKRQKRQRENIHACPDFANWEESQ